MENKRLSLEIDSGNSKTQVRDVITSLKNLTKTSASAESGIEKLGTSLKTLESTLSNFSSKVTNSRLPELTQQIKQTDAASKGLNTRLLRSSQRLDETVQSSRAFNSTLFSTKDALSSLSQDIQGLNSAIKQLDVMNRKFGATSNELRKTAQSSRILTSNFRELTSVLSGVSFALATRETVAFVDSYTNLQNKISVVSKGMIDLDVATRGLLDTSISARSDLESTVDVYSKLIRVNGEYGKSQAEIMQITETVSKAVAMSGASVQGAQGALMQFSQGLASNFRAAGQELNSVIEQTPALAQALASALTATSKLGNVAVSDLKDIAEQGQITTELVLEGFLLIKDSVDKDFNEATRTVGQSFQALTDSLRVFVGEADKALGISASLSEVVTSLAVNLDKYKSIIAAVTAFVAVISTAALGSALASLASFLGLFTPAGAIVAGVAAIAAGIAGMVTETDEFDDSLKDSENTLKQIGQLTSEPFDLFSSTESIDDVSTKLKDARSEVESLKRQLSDPSTIYIRDKISDQLEKAQTSVENYQKALDLLHKSQDQGLFFKTTSAQMTELELIEKTTSAYYKKLTALQQTDKQKYQSIYLIDQYALAAKNEIDITTKLVNLWISQANALFDAEKGTKSTTRSIKERVKTYKQLKAQFDPIVKIENEYNDLVEEINKSSSTRIQKEELLSDALKRKIENLQELKDAEVTVKTITDDIITGLRLQTSALGLNNRQIIQREALTTALNEAKKAGLTLDQESIKSIIAEANAYVDASTALKDYQDSVKERKQLAESFADTFMQGIEAAMSGLENFKDWFKSYLKKLALTALKNRVIIPFSNQVFGLGSQGQAASGQAAGFNPANMLSGGMNLAQNALQYFGGGGGNFLQNQFMDFAYSGFGSSLGLSQASVASVNADKIIPELDKFGKVVHEALGMIGAGLTAYSVAGEHGPVAGTLAGVGSLAAGATLSSFIGGSGLGASFAAGAAMLTNPVGWVIAGIGALLGSLDKPSDKLQTSSIDLASGQTFQDGFEGEKFSQENRNFADALAGTISVMSNFFQSKTGISLDGGIDLLIGNRDGLRLQYNGELVLHSRDSEEFVKKAEDFVAELYGIDLTVYRKLANGSESTLAAMLRLEQQLAAVKDAANLTGHTFSYTGDSAILHSNAIISAAGGLDTFVAGLTRFNQETAMNTEGLAFLAQTERLSGVFRSIGVNELPTTVQGFQELVQSLDLTTEYGRQMYGALMGLAPAFFDFANSLENLMNVVKPLTSLSQSIREQMMSDEELYLHRKTEAEELAASIQTMTDPTEINNAIQKIEQLTSSAWNSLNESQQASMGEEFITFLDEVTEIATNRLEDIVGESVDTGAMEYEASAEEVTALQQAAATDMTAAATELATASGSLQASASEMSQAASALSSAANQIANAQTSNQSREDSFAR